MTPDFINGLFEFGGAIWFYKDVRALMRDRIIKGVYWPARAYFASWGVWNCYYYPAIDQWWSFSGGAALTTLNIIWVALAVYYMRGQHAKDQKGREASSAIGANAS